MTLSPRNAWIALYTVLLLSAPLWFPDPTASATLQQQQATLADPSNLLAPASDAASKPIQDLINIDQVLDFEITKILDKPINRRANWGIEVFSLDEDRVVYTFNGEKTLMPASNVKVLTTAAALDRLGPDYTFKTHVFLDGVVDDSGVARGNLVLKGSGDPTLSGRFFDGNAAAPLQALAKELRAMGIRAVTGDIVGDDSIFPFAPYGKGWQASDLNSYYGAPISALSFNDNLLRVYARPGPRVGSPVQVYFDPETNYVKVRNLAKTGKGRRSRFAVRRSAGGSEITLTGTLSRRSKGHSTYLIIEKPAALTATIFKEALAGEGIEVRGQAQATHENYLASHPMSKVLVTYHSPSLLDIVKVVNKKSMNLYAEILLRVLGAQIHGEGTDEGGLRVVRQYLGEAGVDPSWHSLSDGSGLSRFNLLSPRAETALLRHVRQQDYYNQFVETLAVSGVDGTMRGRSRGDGFSRIFAKTGTLNNVSSLGGYIQTVSGRTLAFTIIANDVGGQWRVRQAIDEICKVLVNY